MIQTRSKIKALFLLAIFVAVVLNLPSCDSDDGIPNSEKVAVLITGWGMPQGYNFHYSWTTSDYPRIGDRTEVEGDPCKIGHVGEFPYASHVSMIPWPITFEVEGWEDFYDNHGVYWYDQASDTYLHINPEVAPVPAGDIPTGTPITPAVDWVSQNVQSYPPDPRDDTDHLEGWFMIGKFGNSFPNGISDLVEQGALGYHRYYGIMGKPEEESEANKQYPATVEQDEYVEALLKADFGDHIDIRYGYYTAVKDSRGKDVTKLHDDVAEDFVKDGFTKMLLARETTDFNNYALEFMTGNFAKERLCELGVLDETELHMSRQVGRTPEYNAMNVENLKPHFGAFPAGSKIGIIYTTRGLTWGADEESPTEAAPLASAHPWSKEVYHENAYLNYIALKEALIKAYGGDYDLVFTKGGAESDLLADNFYTYALGNDIDLKGHGGETVFMNIRDAIQAAKQDGLTQLMIIPGHWNYDNLDTIFRMKELNDIPIAPAEDLAAGIYGVTHCEDNDPGPELDQWEIVDCDAPEAEITILTAPSYSGVPREFATAYYVMLRGALEKFGLYPKGEELVQGASELVTKLDGGTVTVASAAVPDPEQDFSPIVGARIEIPADPQPNAPQDFTPETAEPPSDPNVTNDAMWEDTVITINYRMNPPAMTGLQAVGPAVHFGPYRTIFNQDVTLTIPFSGDAATVRPYVYNHVTGEWEALEVESVDETAGLLVFKTQFLGLFMAAVPQ